MRTDKERETDRERGRGRGRKRDRVREIDKHIERENRERGWLRYPTRRESDSGVSKGRNIVRA